VKKFTSMFAVLTVLFMLLAVLGLAYLLFLQYVFPTLVPSYGSGEPIFLDSYNNYTFQIPWKANTRLHLSFQTDKTVKLYLDGKFLCNCTSYKFIIEPEDTVIVKLEANSPVTGRFTAWQETPLEKQALGVTIVLVGLIGTGVSIIALKKLT
jgi:hypothetical protein